MKYIRFILTTTVILFLTSCVNNESNNLIIGSWSGKEWLIDGKSSNRNVAQTHFTFDDKGNYAYTYSGTQENGTYKIENSMLFTKPKGQEEIAVKITKLTKDSLVFDMNRSGQSETLTLLKTP